MQHILLFKTVRPEFLDFCIDACRRRFPDGQITLIAQSDVPLAMLSSRVDKMITIPPGMISPSSIAGNVLREIKESRPDIAVVPIYNSRLWFYRGPYFAAIETGVRNVLGLNLDGTIYRLTRTRFFLHRLLDGYPAGIAISLSLAPYALWLLFRNWIRRRFENSSASPRFIGLK